jgi:Family of unknown function (DUF6174)
MRRLSLAPLRRVAALALLAAAACDAGPTAADETFDSDLDAARARWVAARPSDYSFELRVNTAWFPPRGHDLIIVRNGAVASVRRLDSGESLPTANAYTIDGIYEVLASFRARGEPLARLRFNADGVPLEAMAGSFANDGGVAYEVRAFRRLR